MLDITAVSAVAGDTIDDPEMGAAWSEFLDTEGATRRAGLGKVL